MTPDVLQDQGPAIRAAIASGGIVPLPAGTLWVGSEIPLPSGVTLQGQGERVTVIKRLPGYLGHIVTATEGPLGPNRYGLRDLTIHGNVQQVPNATGWCFLSKGRAYSIRDVGIEYCAQGGFYSWWPKDAAAWDDQADDSRMEARIDGLHIQFCKGTPVFDGPHDSQIDNLIVGMSRHNQPAQQGSATFIIGANAAGSQFGAVHVWGDFAEWALVNWASAITISNLVVDDARAGGGLLCQLGSDCLISGRGLQFGNEQIKGIQIGHTGIPAAGNRISMTLSAVNPCLIVGSDGGGNTFDLTIPTGAQAVSGTLHPRSATRIAQR